MFFVPMRLVCCSNRCCMWVIHADAVTLNKKKPRHPDVGVAVTYLSIRGVLLAETQSLDDGTIALNVSLLQVRKETTTLTDEFHE